jgi:hypothetical protein
MPEFLTSKSISDRVEQMIVEAQEFIYLVSPYLYNISKEIFDGLKSAEERGVRVVLVYKKGLGAQGKEIEKLYNLSNLTIFCSERLHARAYFNEKEGIVTSFNLLSGEGTYNIDYGIHLTKSANSDMYGNILSETQLVVNQSRQMRIEQSKLVEVPVVRQKPEPKPVEKRETAEVMPGLDPTKKLTTKEKQNLLLELFSKECKDCLIKVEDAERLRIHGAGIVLFTNKERVEIIFVRYASFTPLKDEIKEYILAVHPEIKIWVTYNRITINADRADEVISLFSTVKEAITAYNLA